MARIAGVDIPRQKRVVVGLTYIYGVGQEIAKDILEKTNINPDTRVKNLTEDEVSRLRAILDSEYTIEGGLRKKIAYDIKRLMDIGAYRGTRHKKGLPARGQNTKNNARTCKGPKQTVGANLRDKI